MVDKDLLIISQESLEAELFSLLHQYQYGASVISLYKQLHELNLHKVPMIILLTGPPGIEKAHIAALLADRLNLSSIIKTEIVLEILSCLRTPLLDDDKSATSTTTTIEASPVPAVLDLNVSVHDWQRLFLRECQDTLQGMRADISKHIQEGKSFIIEGIHITPDVLKCIQNTLQGKQAIVASYRLTLDNPPLHREKLNEQLLKLYPSHSTAKDLTESFPLESFDKVQQLERWYEQYLSNQFVCFSAEDHLITQAVQYIHEHFLSLVQNNKILN